MSRFLEKWTNDKVVNPFRDRTSTEDIFDQFFKEMLHSKKKDTWTEMNFSPSSEVVEDERGYQLKFDLPGVPKENVKVEVEGNEIVVSAERRDETEKKEKKRYLSEISYGQYVRSISMPYPIDEKRMVAKYENGVLIVTIPRSETTKAKQIAVH